MKVSKAWPRFAGALALCLGTLNPAGATEYRFRPIFLEQADRINNLPSINARGLVAFATTSRLYVGDRTGVQVMAQVGQQLAGGLSLDQIDGFMLLDLDPIVAIVFSGGYLRDTTRYRSLFSAVDGGLQRSFSEEDHQVRPYALPPAVAGGLGTLYAIWEGTKVGVNGEGLYAGPDDLGGVEALYETLGAEGLSVDGPPTASRNGNIAIAIRSSTNTVIRWKQRFDPTLQVLIASGGMFSAVSTPSINNSRKLAFLGTLAEGGVAGVFVLDDPFLNEVARANATFSAFSSLAINNQDRVVFSAYLPAKEGNGLFAGPDPVQDKIVAPGDRLGVGPGGSKPFRKVKSAVFGPTGLNDNGQVAFRVMFTDGTAAIYRAEPLTPGKLDTLSGRFPKGAEGEGELTVNSGRKGKGIIELELPSNQPVEITLTSSRPDLVSVPSTIDVREGKTKAMFDIVTRKVTEMVTVTVTASSNGVTRTLRLVLSPLR